MTPTLQKTVERIVPYDAAALTAGADPATWCNPVDTRQLCSVFGGAVKLNRTGFFGDLISWEDGVYGTFKSVFSGGARACRSDGRGAPGGPRISVGGAAVGGTEARLHGGDAAEVGAAGAA